MLNEKGQGVVEFAVVILVVLILVIIVLALAGPSVGNVYSDLLPGL